MQELRGHNDELYVQDEQVQNASADNYGSHLVEYQLLHRLRFFETEGRGGFCLSARAIESAIHLTRSQGSFGHCYRSRLESNERRSSSISCGSQSSVHLAYQQECTEELQVIVRHSERLRDLLSRLAQSDLRSHS